jgi:hypothetical protein
MAGICRLHDFGQIIRGIIRTPQNHVPKKIRRRSPPFKNKKMLLRIATTFALVRFPCAVYVMRVGYGAFVTPAIFTLFRNHHLWTWHPPAANSGFHTIWECCASREDERGYFPCATCNDVADVGKRPLVHYPAALQKFCQKVSTLCSQGVVRLRHSARLLCRFTSRVLDTVQNGTERIL